MKLVWDKSRFHRQKHSEFERLTALEYPEVSLDRREAGLGIEYIDAKTQRLWTYWLQAYEQGKRYWEIERADEG
jgi:hypothetical protein